MNKGHGQGKTTEHKSGQTPWTRKMDRANGHISLLFPPFANPYTTNKRQIYGRPKRLPLAILSGEHYNEPTCSLFLLSRVSEMDKMQDS